MINDKYFEVFPVLSTERLVLREFKLSDAQDIYEIRSNPQVMRFMDSYPHKNLAESQKFIATGLEDYKNKLGIFWCICQRSDGQVVGDISFWKISRSNSRAEIGYSLKEKYWGKGYMSEVMSVLFDFAFDAFNVHSIEANINPVNEASRKVLLKQGFKKEAYFREHFFFDGRYIDSEIYSLLKQDRFK